MLRKDSKDKRRAGQTALAIVLSCHAAGCVARARYDACLADASGAKQAALAEKEQSAARASDLERQLAAAQADTEARDTALSDLTTSDHNLQARLDEATAINQQLRDELGRLGKDVDKMLAERGTMARALDDAKARLGELRRAESAADAQAALFGDFERRFKPLIDAGQLRVESQRGELVLSLDGDFVFEAGKSELRPSARGALMEIAKAITPKAPAASAPVPASAPRYLVTAHVDAAEISVRKAHSPWELTALRAATVALVLVSLGVPQSSLLAGGAGPDSNAREEFPGGRARGHRVDLTLLCAPPELAAASSK